MIKVFRKVKGLHVLDLYFTENLLSVNGGEDIQYYVQSSQAVVQSTHFFTSIIDLNADEAMLSKAIKKGFVYEIRRATEKDLINAKIIEKPSLTDIENYAAFFGAFAKCRELGGANIRKLKELAKVGALIFAISRSSAANQVWLSAHAYISDGLRARLLYSASNIYMNDTADRQLVGRANKFLHWHMIQHFKNAGYQKYDLGGISKSVALKQIDDFKESFGGTEVKEFNLICGVSLKGKIAVVAFRVMSYIKTLRLNPVK